MVPRIRITLAYLGTPFRGWQKQPNVRTVQGELEERLARLYQCPIGTVAAGRTDAGVHADGQVVHFDPPYFIPPKGVQAALNSLLPHEIRIVKASQVSSSFHARRSAVGKRYRYRLAWGPPLSPWPALRRLWIPYHPDREELSSALALCTGLHDFRRFALAGHSGHGKRGTVRRLFWTQLHCRSHQADLIFEGDGFLRGMVRRLVGALLEVASGRRSREWLVALLAGGESDPEPPTAPASGLTLEHVYYRRRQNWGSYSGAQTRAFLPVLDCLGP